MTEIEKKLLDMLEKESALWIVNHGEKGEANKLLDEFRTERLRAARPNFETEIRNAIRSVHMAEATLRESLQGVPGATCRRIGDEEEERRSKESE